MWRRSDISSFFTSSSTTTSPAIIAVDDSASAGTPAVALDVRGSGHGKEKGSRGFSTARRDWKIVLGVAVGYVVIGGVEAGIAGSVVGVVYVSFLPPIFLWPVFFLSGVFSLRALLTYFWAGGYVDWGPCMMLVGSGCRLGYRLFGRLLILFSWC